MQRNFAPVDLIKEILQVVPPTAKITIGNPASYGDEDFLIEILLPISENRAEIDKAIKNIVENYDKAKETSTLVLVTDEENLDDSER
jgi:hypothetical protein